MVDISNGVFLIGLLSVLSLDAADVFSDGTADYVVVDWVEARTLEDTMREESIEYNYDFKLEIFPIKGEDAKCLYKVLRVYSSPEMDGKFGPGRRMTRHPLVFGHLIKASCSVSLSTLSEVVRYSLKYGLGSIEYKLEGNICRTFYLPITDYHHDSQCQKYPPIPKSAELKPAQLDWELRQSHLDGSIIWDEKFWFLVKFTKGQNHECVESSLEVDYTTGDGPWQFNKFKQFECSCGVDILSLHRFVKKTRDPDTLVFKLKDGTCLRTKAKYDAEAERIIVEDKTVVCDEFFNRSDTVQ